METFLATTLVANATIGDIMTSLDQLANGSDFQSFRFNPEIRMIDWNHFEDTLNSAIQFQDNENYQVQ